MQFPVPRETFASNDVNELIRKGHSVSVYALKPKHDLSDELIAQRGHEALDIVSLSMRNYFSGVLYGLSNPRQSLSLLRWVDISGGKIVAHLIKGLLLVASAIYIEQEISLTPPDFGR